MKKLPVKEVSDGRGLMSSNEVLNFQVTISKLFLLRRVGGRFDRDDSDGVSRLGHPFSAVGLGVYPLS